LLVHHFCLIIIGVFLIVLRTEDLYKSFGVEQVNSGATKIKMKWIKYWTKMNGLKTWDFLHPNPELADHGIKRAI